MIVWDGTLDGRYYVSVKRVREYVGELVVSDIKENKIIHKQEVKLAYNATFGPDMEDVDEWVTISENIVDKENNNGKERNESQ